MKRLSDAFTPCLVKCGLLKSNYRHFVRHKSSKCWSVIAMSLSFLFSLSAFAEYSSDAQLIDTAQVHSAVPAYRTIKEVTPRQECWVETVTEHHHVPARYERSDTPALVGTVIGGAVGHSVGHGRSNKRLGAVVGSVLGAAVGSSIARDNARRHGGYTDTRYHDVERCKTIEEVSTRRVFDGYDVAYEYQGNMYTTRMNKKPGKTLDVAISISPLQ